MKRSITSQKSSLGTHALVALLITAALGSATASEPAPADQALGNSAKNLARMNCGAKIECITPDGREGTVATANEQNQSAAALIMADDTLSCPLKEGETTFIITLPTTSLVDRFTFLNENAAARGQMSIAVSNYQLPATSTKWNEVDGRIPFANKRQFDFSIVGVEARFVKFTFRVDRAPRLAAAGL